MNFKMKHETTPVYSVRRPPPIRSFFTRLRSARLAVSPSFPGLCTLARGGALGHAPTTPDAHSRNRHHTRANAHCHTAQTKRRLWPRNTPQQRVMHGAQAFVTFPNQTLPRCICAARGAFVERRRPQRSVVKCSGAVTVGFPRSKHEVGAVNRVVGVSAHAVELRNHVCRTVPRCPAPPLRRKIRVPG